MVMVFTTKFSYGSITDYIFVSLIYTYVYGEWPHFHFMESAIASFNILKLYCNICSKSLKTLNVYKVQGFSLLLKNTGTTLVGS